MPEPYWLVNATFDPRYPGIWFDPQYQPRDDGVGNDTWLKSAERADEVVAARRRQGRPRRVGRAQGAVRARAAPLRPHVATARREPALRLLGAAHAARRPVAVRGQEGDHLPAHELTLAVRRPRPAAQADGRDARAHPRVRRRGTVRAHARPAPAGPRGERREGRRPPRDHPDRRRARRVGLHGRRAPRVRPRRAPLPGRVPPAGALRAHDDRHGGRGRAVPDAGQDHARAGLARRLRVGVRRGQARVRRGRGRRPRATGARAGPDRALRRSRGRAQGHAPAASLQRGDAALGHGDRGQARHRRGAPRRHEGARPRHARHARGDDRDAHPPRVRGARRQGPPADAEGPPGHHDARGAPADLARAHRRLGEAPGRHRARQGGPAALHGRDRDLRRARRSSRSRRWTRSS